jgi:hypothetical protein
MNCRMTGVWPKQQIFSEKYWLSTRIMMRLNSTLDCFAKRVLVSTRMSRQRSGTSNLQPRITILQPSISWEISIILDLHASVTMKQRLFYMRKLLQRDIFSRWSIWGSFTKKDMYHRVLVSRKQLIATNKRLMGAIPMDTLILVF